MSGKLSVFIGLLAMSVCAAGQSSSDFVKKWNIDDYIYLGFSFSPEENEKNDYLHFRSDGTFQSNEEGKIEHGKWKWEAEKRSLVLMQGDESIAIEVVTVAKHELILRFEEDGDSIKVKYLAD